MERLAKMLCAFDCTVTIRLQEPMIGFTIDSSVGQVGSRRASSGVVTRQCNYVSRLSSSDWWTISSLAIYFISTVISAVVQTEDGCLDCSPYRIRCLSGVCAADVEDGRYYALAETRKHDRENVKDHTHLETLEHKRLNR